MMNPRKPSSEEQLLHKVNDLIMDISKIYVSWHDKEQDFGIEHKLRRVEIHTIQAIGNNKGVNLTQLAKVLNVTKPTVFEKIEKLIKLGLVEKTPSSKNNKEIMLSLTKQGWVAYDNHERKHKLFFELFRDHFSENSMQYLNSFEKDLEKFHKFLNVLRGQSTDFK